VSSYVCSKNVTNYEHFGEVGQGRCPLNENVEDRHEQEVKKAADEAMAKVRADNPSLSDADLMIKVSDRVKQAEDARKGRAQVQANAFPYHMVGDQLQNHAGPPLVPALYPPVQPMAPVAQYVPVHPYAVAPAPFFVHPQPLAQVPQYLQPVQQPVPYHHNDPGQAALQPHQYVCFCHTPPPRSFPYPYIHYRRYAPNHYH
jgi:TRIAD3 protein (E3 ubiquitin-protein ligase RNF216)